MKKILALAMLAVSMTATAYSQNGPKTSLKWSYRMSAFNKTYLVGGEDKGGEYNLYICGESMFPDMADEIGILVEYKNVQRFLTYLKQLRSKYIRWSDIARKNNVKNFYKDMGYGYTGSSFYRHNGQYYKVINTNLDAWFSVDLKGKAHLKITPTKYIADGKRNGGRFKLVFSSLGELDALIKIVKESGEKLAAKRNKTSGVDALFQ